MTITKKMLLIGSMFCSAFSGAHLSTVQDDFTYKLSGKFKPETFYGNRVSQLNSDCGSTDQIWYARHTFDLNADVLYGKETYGSNIAELHFNLRNKAVWGNPTSITKTTSSTTKDLEVVGHSHKHAIPRHILWMREAYLSFNINEALNLSFNDSYKFTIGAFPFELGRGIAFGDSYAVGPEFLGFYSDGAVDQYAFGALLEGDIVENRLHYNLYSAILQNKSSSLSDTGAKIRGQEFGHFKDQARGFGKINFAVTNSFNWLVFDNDYGKTTLEPYVLYNYDPEQTVEFLGDASSHLGTFGLAGEYSNDTFEFGFDGAFNVGNQHVKGWDRNQIKTENRNAHILLVNSHVVDGSATPKTIPYVSSSEAQGIINNSSSCHRDESFNDKTIGTTTGTDSLGDLTNPIILKNKADRFRNPYKNKYKGWMLVGDASWWAYKKDLKLSVTAGITSGDDNPNIEKKDGVFSGFIPLQETYSGKRVKSAFLLGGAGKLNRPLSVPTDNQGSSKFTQAVSGFTNLMFVGAGAHWEPSNVTKKLVVKPNALFFWQEKSLCNSDTNTTKKHISTKLGGELNVFVDYYMFENTKLFFVSSVFLPGQHFTDISGKQLTAEQLEALDQADVTGLTNETIKGQGDSVAYTLNAGLEFKF